MAIKTFTATLNGGDLVTADNDLIFKIYGSADSYTTAIATTGSHTTDADVTVAGDVVTIENIDVGSETAFKISSIDESANESILSDAFGINAGLQFDNTDRTTKGSLSAMPTTVTFEVRAKITGPNNTVAAFGYEASNASSSKLDAVRYIVGTSGTEIRMITGDGVNTQTQYIPIAAYDGLYHIYKTVLLADGSYEHFIDGVSKATGTNPLGIIAPNSHGVYIGNAGTATSSFIGIIDWVKVNSETFELNEGAGVTSTGDDSTVVALTNPDWVTI